MKKSVKNINNTAKKVAKKTTDKKVAMKKTNNTAKKADKKIAKSYAKTDEKNFATLTLDYETTVDLKNLLTNSDNLTSYLKKVNKLLSKFFEKNLKKAKPSKKASTKVDKVKSAKSAKKVTSKKTTKVVLPYKSALDKVKGKKAVKKVAKKSKK